MRPWIKCLVAVLASLLVAACGSKNNDSSDGGGQKTDGGTDAGVIVGAAPILDSATAQVAGRTGKDLRIAFAGKDSDGNVAVAVLRYADQGGSPVLAFDSNMDGTSDSAEGPAAFDSSLDTKKTFDGTVTVRNLFAQYPQIAVVTVVLRDELGNKSNEIVAAVALQPVKSTGEQCDPNSILDRCEPSFGCRGTPATCQEGQAPSISKFAFLTTSTGPRLLFEGLEPEDDLATIRVEFQDLAGDPLDLDLDGDDVADGTSVDLNAQGTSADGKFFYGMQAAQGFDTMCPQIAATPIDSANHVGAVIKAKPTAIPIRGSGAACDPHGFDTCATNSICSPGIVGSTNKCMSATSARTNECKNAPTLDPALSKLTVTGRAEGTSLWDVPMDCSSQNPTNRPEGVAKLHLTQAYAKVTISTEHPGTDFDTTVYLLTGCPDTNKDALGCADDSPDGSAASTLELTNVPAGDYLIVVDSFQTAGGNYELTVKVQ